MNTKKITIYTDGSCKGNPGPGGWCAIIFIGDEKKPAVILKGGEAKTTNNRMEMVGVIEAFKYIDENHLQRSSVTLYSDSNLVIKTLTAGWKRKANIDLWEELDRLNEELKVDYIWVRGHNENKWNEECDKHACAEAQKIAKINYN
jgi:ribonuclease HI